MKTRLFICLLLLFLLPGCSEDRQIENQAFAVILGLDVNADGSLALTVQIPKPNGAGDQKQAEKYQYISASGQSFSEALELLKLSSPHHLNLTQVKMIVASESLAGRESFPTVLSELAETYTLYATSWFVVCGGKTDDFLHRQEALLAGGASSSLAAILEHHSRLGSIPFCTFADLYYHTNSVYSDPIAVYAAFPGDGSPIEEVPADVHPQGLPVEQSEGIIYSGGALFRDGVMVGRLTAGEMMFCSLLRGRIHELNCAIDEGAFYVQTAGRARLSYTLDQDPMRILYDQTLHVYPRSGQDDTTELEDWLKARIGEVVTKCQLVGVEPFAFSESAARTFPALKDWQAFDWRSRFGNAELMFELKLDLRKR